MNLSKAIELSWINLHTYVVDLSSYDGQIKARWSRSGIESSSVEIYSAPIMTPQLFRQDKWTHAFVKVHPRIYLRTIILISWRFKNTELQVNIFRQVGRVLKTMRASL